MFCDRLADLSDGLHEFLVLASMALLGVGWQGGLSSLTFPAMTVTVDIFPNDGFRRFYSFVVLLRNLHALKYLTCLLVGFPLKVPSL